MLPQLKKKHQFQMFEEMLNRTSVRCETFYFKMNIFMNDFIVNPASFLTLGLHRCANDFISATKSFHSGNSSLRALKGSTILFYS